MKFYSNKILFEFLYKSPQFILIQIITISMLKLNHRFEHLQDVFNAACKAPLSFTWEWIIIIVCCVLGLLWAAYNIYLVLQIKVREGITGDK